MLVHKLKFYCRKSLGQMFHEYTDALFGTGVFNSDGIHLRSLRYVHFGWLISMACF